jgi:hypothetical protein
MNAEWQIAKVLGWSFSGAFDLLYHDLLEGTADKAQHFSVALASFPIEIQNKHLPLQVQSLAVKPTYM